MICLSRQIMESEFEKYIEKIFKLPEVKNAKVRDVIIDRDNKTDTIKQAFDIGYGYSEELAYDRLAKEFYPEYKERSSILFEIWDYYHKNRA